MITPLARLIGVTALGSWLDRQPEWTAAWLRLGVVLVVFATPLLALAFGRLAYGDAFWWLWLDAFVVGVWTLVTLVSRRAPGDAVAFFAVHYLVMFTLIPGVLYAWLLGPQLPPAQAWPWPMALIRARAPARRAACCP